MSVKFSIIFPTRNRANLLSTCLHSFVNLCKNPNNIEYIISIDYGDNLSFAVLNKIRDKLNINLHIRKVVRTKNIHVDYFNPSAIMAVGKYVWGINDDVEITAQNWDIILEEEIEQFLLDKPDRLCYVKINHDILTLNREQEACAFPVFTKEHVNAIGGTMPSQITSSGADYECWLIYKNLIENRILDLSDKIFVLHHSHHTGRTPRDIINKRLDQSVNRLRQHERDEYIHALDKCIRNGKCQ